MTHKDLDYLIVGQGLAASVLALTLLKQQKKIILFSDRELKPASAVAAGLYNPITGRKMSKTWQAETLFPFLENFYTEQEAILNSRFFYPSTIYRPFISIEEQNTWIAETSQPDIARFAEICQDDNSISTAVNAPYGGMLIHHAGYLNVKSFLSACHEYFDKIGIVYNHRLDHTQIQFSGSKVQYKDVTAQQIIFCEGPYATENLFFNWLPFRPVKGEVLHVVIDDFVTNYIINQHLFVIPLPDGTFRVGATYNWRTLDWQPSESGKAELLEKLSRLVQRPVHILDHSAGIRPATADRRPFIGTHPEHPELAFFGGMGSKGVSLIPYLAQHFIDFLLFQKEIMPEININRYLSLYKK
ncbi:MULTISPECIES: FAD-dependent oxidoreductase [Xanthocytophaga]|uniref:FAD-dependent oxidoreductase n=2 Tax=Xanthocytophaga TaxID=3078918 RepID=A0AAE3QJK4_9BACT|nr:MULTISPECIES: FAD-dependent oxidoreductase [Xanthocytophaga]MDJ1480552.1 FAD-dependent oxidoreductase [Xanthocytophaga flavus]MDJ1504530.1 FAD-dependent oxidoreductase [Xanthocytophaga agilis]